MAEDEGSGRPGPRNAWEYLHTSDEERRAYRKRLRDDRAAASAALGATIIDRTKKKFAPPPSVAHRAELAADFGLPVSYREPRSPDWAGPSSGLVFADATELRTATIADCEAGFLATWGYAMTAANRDAFVVTINGALPAYASEVEAEAKEIYSRLHLAIRDASEFAARHDYGETPAAAVLCELAGLVPALPPLGDLPGYSKYEAPRARLVHQWQEMAAQGLGRLLTLRELAELSILLGVADPPYGQLVGRAGKMSAAQVIDWEKKRIAKVDQLPT